MATLKNQGDESLVELGYLLLESTPIRILAGESEIEGSKEQEHWLPKTWYNLKLVDDSGSKSHVEMPEDDYQTGNLGVFPGEPNGTLHLPWELVRSVDSPPPPQSTRQCVADSTQMSDGAMLFGLLKYLRYDVCVVQCRVLFLDFSCQHAALYVTLAFPHLSRTTSGKMSLLGSRTAKNLSDGMQLLLSLIRSDWDEFEQRIAALANSSLVHESDHQASVEKPTTTLFPPRLSMEELYRRIRTSHFDHEQSRMNLDRQLSNQPSARLAKLPRDILVRRLAPFLSARDLDSIRGTCSYFHGLLEGVVPGLNLQLYRHQHSSLVWMRDRERHELIEADCLKEPDKTLLRSPDGDLHRAVTGGHTVRLSPREKGSTDGFRINTFTGREYDALSGTGSAPQRRVCRGGLLSDEPGLGKTAVCLSLILQTAGLSTESSRQSAMDRSDEVDDEALFSSYWRENVPKDFRRQNLLKLLNAVAKRLPRRYFLRVRKRIDLDSYADDFSLFENDIE